MNKQRKIVAWISLLSVIIIVGGIVISQLILSRAAENKKNVVISQNIDNIESVIINYTGIDENEKKQMLESGYSIIKKISQNENFDISEINIEYNQGGPNFINELKPFWTMDIQIDEFYYGVILDADSGDIISINLHSMDYFGAPNDSLSKSVVSEISQEQIDELILAAHDFATERLLFDEKEFISDVKIYLRESDKTDSGYKANTSTICVSVLINELYGYIFRFTIATSELIEVASGQG